MCGCQAWRRRCGTATGLERQASAKPTLDRGSRRVPLSLPDKHVAADDTRPALRGKEAPLHSQGDARVGRLAGASEVAVRAPACAREAVVRGSCCGEWRPPVAEDIPRRQGPRRHATNRNERRWHRGYECGPLKGLTCVHERRTHRIAV